MKNLFLTLLVFFSAASNAETALPSLQASQNLVTTQLSLESRLTNIARLFDKDALVMVKFALQERDPFDIATPFYLSTLDPAGDTGERVISRADITVLGRLPEIPKDLNRLIQDATLGVAPRYTVKLESLPTPFSIPVVAPPPPKVERPDLWQQTKRLFQSQKFSTFLLVLILGTLSIGAVLLGAHLQRNASTITQSLERVANAIEVQTELPAPVVLVAQAQDGFKDMFSSLPKEGLAALLMDCYWGKHDSYASFIWRRLSSEQKQELTTQVDYLSDYSSHLSTVAESNFNAEQEAYYLRPLPLNHLNNTTVTELVKKTPGLLFKVSLLRRTSLLFNAQEKVEITKAALTQSSVALPEFHKLARSPKREFKSGLVVPFHSLNEEAAIVGTTRPALDIVKAMPTLGWITLLPKEQGTKMLQQFSAKELATAWIGPQEILEQLLKLMPSPKQELLKAYLLRITPNRNSAVFQALQEQTVVQFQQQTQVSHHVVQKAA